MRQPPSIIVTQLTLCLLSPIFFHAHDTSSLVQNKIPQPQILPTNYKKPIKKIAIIGSGIAGLTLAHALQNDNNNNNSPTTTTTTIDEISLFDSRPTLDPQTGAGIQINGGMSILRRINPTLQKKVAMAGLPLTKIRSRTKPWWFDRKNNPFSTLLEFDIGDIIRKTGGNVAEQLISDEGDVMSYSIMRGAFQEVLANELPPSIKKRMSFGKTLDGISPSTTTTDSSGIMCHFTDGTTAGPFDLVVGCDGIKSRAKRFVDSGTTGPSSSSVETDDDVDPWSIYSGIRIQFAVRDGKRGSNDDDSDDYSGKEFPNNPTTAELRQYFGDGAYALRGVYGAGNGKRPCHSAFLIFRDDDYIGPFRRKRRHSSKTTRVAENADWTQDVRGTTDAKKLCLQRLTNASIPSDDLISVVEESDRFFELGVYFHNPFRWSGWSRKVEGLKDDDDGEYYVVLGGDAAHAMPPFLGQGANQAVQDAYCLAEQIHGYNNDIVIRRPSAEEGGSTEPFVAPSLGDRLKDYERRRWRPTADLTLKAAFLGYLEVGAEGLLSKFRDVFFFTMGKVGVARKVFLDGATPKV